MASHTELDPLVSQYQHESHRPRADHAIFTLRKIASIVKPMMRRRNWKVGILAEFYPSEQNLLGLNTNRGQKINLRLRYAGDANQFLPLEEVVDTMLHELCHNEIGPHNAQFHALWDQLRDEHEALLRKGYTGEGFLGRGDRLGGQRIPIHEAKRRARAAAEQRRILTAGSGQRLGGSGILRGQDARSVIASAVERRIRVERGCASGTDTGRQVAHNEEIKKEKVTTTQAEQEDQNEAAIMQAYIDLIEEEESAIFGKGYVPPSAENPAGPRGQLSENSKARSLVTQQRQLEQEILRQKTTSSSALNDLPVQPQPDTPTVSTPSRAKSPPRPPPDEEPQDTWTCEICTLVNPINFLSCDACTVERPAYYSSYNNNPSPPASSSQKPREKELPNSLKPRLKSAQAYEKFERERAAKVASKPIGWQCLGCGNWMEQEWWTCSACGKMKSTS